MRKNKKLCSLRRTYNVESLVQITSQKHCFKILDLPHVFNRPFF